MARQQSVLAAESLEPRALLAVTATLSGSDLQISLGAADDIAYLSNDGTNYIVRGTGLSGYAAAVGSVSSVSVAGTAAVNQSFTVAAGVGAVLTDPLSIAASVEQTTIVGAVNTTGEVLVDSAAITLAADVTTTGQQRYKGATGLVGDRTLSAGAGNVTFESTVDSSPAVFADPDAFAAGTPLTTAFSGITFSAVGTDDTGVVVKSNPSDVTTPTTGFYAPTGNRLFASGATDSAWNAPGNIFKAAFASPVAAVSLDFAPNDANDTDAYLEAYDSKGDVVGVATYPLAVPELSSVTLAVSAPSIAYVLASFDAKGSSAGLLDNLQATLATTPSAALTVNSTGATTFGGVVGGIAALASLTTNAGGTVTLKSVTTTGAQSYGEDATLNGTYTTTDSGFTVSGNATLAGDTTISTGDGAGNIQFGSTLDGAQTLSLTAGTGNVSLGGLVGSATPLGAITINSATNVTANGIRAASLTQVAGSGTTTLNGGAFTAAPAGTEAVRTSAVAGVSLTGTNLAVNALIATANGGGVTVTNKTGTVTIAAAGDITSDGDVSLTGGGGITTAGDITTTNDPVTFASATTLSGPVAISTGAGLGTITFSKALDGNQTLSLEAGTGNIAFKGAVGSVTPLGGIAILSAASTTADSTIKLDGSSKLAADGLTISENVNNVSFPIKGSEIKNFTGNGVFFKGGSTNSLLSGFTVSGNGGNGMQYAVGSYAGTTVTANTISDNGDKTAGVGNGILVQGQNLMIGWDANPASNTAQNIIKKNALNGIEVRGSSATGNSILSNKIFLNGIDETGTMRTKVENGATVTVGKGIALTEQGNESQVAPIIHDVVWDKKEGAGVVRVQLVVPAAGSYFVQVFSNTAADEQGIFPVDVNGFEGRTFVGPARAGSTPVAGSKPTIAGAGIVTGNTLAILEIPDSQLAAGNWLTATATALSGTTPTNTSEFSAGVQLLAAPALAVGGDGPSATWSTEYGFTAGAKSSKTIQLTTNGAGQPFTQGQLQGLAKLKSGTKIVVTPTGGDVNEVLTVAKASLKRSVLTITLTESIGTTAGTFVLGGTSLPAAMLLNTSLDGVAAQNPLLSVGDAEIRAALIGAGVSQPQADAFVTRFQGGLRVASGDFNGDGHTDLVTVAGGLPAAMANTNTFGAAPLVLSIHNADPNTRGTWADVSVNLANIAGFVSAGYANGFLVTMGNVWEEKSGSGSVVQELIVASSTKIAVIEVEATRGGKPVIKTDTARVIDLSTSAPGAWTTGLAAGNFRPANDSTKLDDILVATTTATSAMQVSKEAELNTSSVQLFRANVGVPNQPVLQGSFFVNDVIQVGPPRGGVQRLENAFLNGASLAVGDIDNADNQRPELLLAAGVGGLGNFRVLGNAVVSGLDQATINQQLGPNGRFAAPPRSPSPKWQPTGGPDFFIGGSPTAPMANGSNAGMFAALVESSGRSSGSGGSGFKAEVFAALAGPNQTLNSIRQFWFDETQQPANRWRSAHGSGSWLNVAQTFYKDTSVTKKLGVGRGLRLG